MHGALVLTKTVFFPMLQSSLRVVLVRKLQRLQEMKPWAAVMSNGGLFYC